MKRSVADTKAAGSHAHDLSATIVGIPKTVRTFGAKGDGVTDDTTAIRAALAAGVGSFPAGTYLTSPLLVPPGVTLRGDSGQSYYNATPIVPNAATLSRLKLKAGSTAPLLSPDDSGAIKATAVCIFDLALDCNGLPQPALNLPDQAQSISRFWRMERLYLSNIGGATGYAAYVGNQNTACTMRDCVIFNGTSGSPAGANGVGWYGSDGLLDNTFIGYFTGAGLTVIGGQSDTTFVMRGGGSFTCTTGIVSGSRGAVLDGVSIDHNLNDGIYVGFGPTVISNCTFHSNSRAANDTWSNITVGADDVQMAVMGCRAAPRDADAGSNDPKYMIDRRGHANLGIVEFGNFQEAGAVLVSGWTG